MFDQLQKKDQSEKSYHLPTHRETGQTVQWKVPECRSRRQWLQRAVGSVPCLTYLQVTCCQSSCEAEGTVPPWPHEAHFLADELWQERGSFSQLIVAPGDSRAVTVIAGTEWELAWSCIGCIFKAITSYCTEFPRRVVDSLSVGTLKSNFLAIQRVVMSWCRQKGCAWCGDLLLTCSVEAQKDLKADNQMT